MEVEHEETYSLSFPGNFKHSLWCGIDLQPSQVEKRAHDGKASFLFLVSFGIYRCSHAVRVLSYILPTRVYLQHEISSQSSPPGQISLLCLGGILRADSEWTGTNRRREYNVQGWGLSRCAQLSCLPVAQSQVNGHLVFRRSPGHQLLLPMMITHSLVYTLLGLLLPCLTFPTSTFFFWSYLPNKYPGL